MKKRTKLETREGVVGKTCARCSNWKSLSEFSKAKRGLGGKASKCRQCRRILKGSIKTRSVVEITTLIIDGVEFQAKACTECNEVKILSHFYSSNKGLAGKRAKCKDCLYEIDKNDFNKKLYQKQYREDNAEKLREYKSEYRIRNSEKIRENLRIYAQENKERLAKYALEYQRNNKDRVKLKNIRYKARKASLPDTLTEDEQKQILNTFNHSCALTGEIDNIHLDHVIPLSVGFGGTTYENIVPMRGDLNISKSNRNLFEWFEQNKEWYGLSQDKFNSLIDYLAEINKMSVAEYRSYYNNCFVNYESSDKSG